MTNEIKEVTETVKVPKGTGIDGFLVTIRKILELPRVQTISIAPTGDITFRYFSPEGTPAGERLGLEFDTLMASDVIRNSEQEEIPEDPHGAIAIARMFKAAATDLLTPVAFACGVATKFWDWHYASTSLPLPKMSGLYGLPLLPDPKIPNEALYLLAAFGRGATLIDSVKSYRLLIPEKAKEIQVL